MVNVKVLVCYNFRKNWKKMKSPSSMRSGRFHPPKCRGKVQKMEVLYIHSSKMPGLFPYFLIILQKKKKLKKLERGEVGRKGPACSLSDYGLRPASNRWLPAGPMWVP
jgi:hypothetical protein